MYGHERGDQLLVEIAQDLCAPWPRDTVARVGGDEFVILLDRLPRPRAPAGRGRHRHRARYGGRSRAGEHALQVTASAGVATIDLAVEPDARPDQLLSRADAAMYLAKERGRNQHHMFRYDCR